MKPRSFLNFFKSPSGRLLIFGLLLAGVMVLVARRANRDLVPTLVRAGGGKEDGKPQIVEAENRPMELFRPLADRSEPSPPAAEPKPKKAAVAPQAAPEHGPISLVADALAGVPEPKTPEPADAPFGRLLTCETVITVDSSRIQTPIIGLITENLYYAGSLVIPAGTEVHGTAQSDHARERIASGTSWTLVWQSGEALRLRAIALDREFGSATNQVGWGITDGSAGLRGRLVKSDEWAEAKLFAATFLQGVAGALTEKETTLLGAIDSRSLNNAPLKGADEVLGVYAHRVLDSIERDGFFVRIPSGKQFYLYVLEPIVLAHRVIPELEPPESVSPEAIVPPSSP